jgi:hypothetical protein
MFTNLILAVKDNVSNVNLIKVNFRCGSTLISGVCPFPRKDVCVWMELSILVKKVSKSISFDIFFSSLHKFCTIQVPKFKSLFDRVAVQVQKIGSVSVAYKNTTHIRWWKKTQQNLSCLAARTFCTSCYCPQLQSVGQGCQDFPLCTAVVKCMS